MKKNYTSIDVVRNAHLRNEKRRINSQSGTKWLLNMMLMFGVLFSGFDGSALTSQVTTNDTSAYSTYAAPQTILTRSVIGTSSSASYHVGNPVAGTCAAPTAPTGSLSITNSTCLSSCRVSGGSVSLGSVTNLNGEGTVEYSTNAGATWSSDLPAYNAPQTIIASVVNAGGCRSSTTFVGATVAGTCTTPATPIISASGIITFCEGGNVQLTSSTRTGYSWSTGATTQIITVTTPGNYTLAITNASGCQSALSAVCTVSVAPQPFWYLDTDGDHYYSSSTQSCTSPGAGYTQTGLLGGGDCDDSVAGHNGVAGAQINPGQAEVCYNNVDDNCNSPLPLLSEGCAPVVVNMMPSYNNTTVPSFSTAIPAVVYSYPGTSNIKYRFLITNVTTNTTAPAIIQASRYVTIPASIHDYNATYTIKVSAVINDEVVAFAGNTITLFSPSVHLITLAPESCGATLASLTSTLTARPGSNATGYIFRIRLDDANPTPTYGYSLSLSRFVGANTFTGFPLSYETSYKVAVEYTFNDPSTNQTTHSGYGAECTFTTPSIPFTNLASPVCGSQVGTMNAGITAAPAPYTNGYQFRIRMTSDNGPTPTYYYTVVNPSRFSSLTAFQGITFAYNTDYSIAVQYSIVTNDETVWSGYGPECMLTTPFFPTTSLVQSQCGLTTPTSLSQQLNIRPYQGFPNYRVKLEEITAEVVTDSQELVFSYPYFKLNQFSIAQEGKSYKVSVAIKQGNVFGDYATTCDLFTAPARSEDLNVKSEISLRFKAAAYPNPFANSFMIDLKTNNSASVNVKVYDMVGRLIEQRDVLASDMETTTIGDRFPIGVYNVVVSQEDSVETFRVIKR